tara:strand:- start:786 stop:950 length:165 start_codon:yes stop_codon:yes gene_type:complete
MMAAPNLYEEIIGRQRGLLPFEIELLVEDRIQSFLDSLRACLISNLLVENPITH